MQINDKIYIIWKNNYVVLHMLYNSLWMAFSNALIILWHNVVIIHWHLFIQTIQCIGQSISIMLRKILLKVSYLMLYIMCQSLQLSHTSAFLTVKYPTLTSDFNWSLDGADWILSIVYNWHLNPPIVVCIVVNVSQVKESLLNKRSMWQLGGIKINKSCI